MALAEGALITRQTCLAARTGDRRRVLGKYRDWTRTSEQAF